MYGFAEQIFRFKGVTDERKPIQEEAEAPGMLVRDAWKGSGHLTVRRGNLVSQLPMHGSRKELGRGLIAKIKEDLKLE